ncbi:glycosyltransferase family 4 protein [Balneolaceae bacterium ANBcel3]|nr:glycosyltransferase family 4 protein [Balneolaceae bacterium ANBcel3]
MKLIVNKTLSDKSTYGGGVGGYYRALRKYNNDFNYLDATYSIKNNNILRFIWEYFRAQVRLYKLQKKASVIIYNPSLAGYSWFRDLIQMRILSRGQVKRVVFFRGWNDKLSNKISTSLIYKKIFNYIYNNKVDAYIVLSSTFKKHLVSWGVKKPIFVETTIVDENLLNEFSTEKKSGDKSKFELLFLSRVEKAKGALEAVQAVHLLTERSNSIYFNIAGNGSAITELEQYIFSNELSNIRLIGYVKGEQKVEAFKQANIFIFPSNHGEGMPNSLLEAMAFGLPVLTTRVGGIPDFFEEGKMGLFLDNRDPEHIAKKIQFLLDRPELMKEMSRYNYEYAKDHFYASKVAARLKNIIDDVTEGRV